MRSYNACYMGELKKLSLRKKYVVITIMSALVCVVIACIYSLADRAARGENLSLNINMPMMVMSFFTQIVMPLVVFMAVCDLFASEYRDLSIKAQLMRPVTRFKVYTAKLCAAFTLCAIVFMSIFVVSAVADLTFDGGSDGLWYSFGAYVLNLIPMCVIILMAAFINQFTKSSTSAMFLCIIVYILMKVVGILAPMLDSLLFTGYLEWHRLFLGTVLPLDALVAKCVLLFGYGLTFFSGGYFLFIKREF